MTITYEPPLHRSGAHPGEWLEREPISGGPAYLRSRAAGRWHRVRSGIRRLQHDGEIRERYQTWCGQSPSTEALLIDEPPADDPLCGTCEGRYIGACTGERWLFQPERLVTPKRCPGSQDARVHEPGPGLIDGCPFHAWRELTLARTESGEQVAACRCQTVERAS